MPGAYSTFAFVIPYTSQIFLENGPSMIEIDKLSFIDNRRSWIQSLVSVESDIWFQRINYFDIRGAYLPP